MKLFEILKRKIPAKVMPDPDFTDNWKQEQYAKNVKEGVLALQSGKKIIIHDDGRGYELALEIKLKFMLEYQKQLPEKIVIKASLGLLSSNGTITIEIKPNLTT